MHINLYRVHMHINLCRVHMQTNICIVFRFVVLPCFDLGLTVPIYTTVCIVCTHTKEGTVLKRMKSVLFPICQKPLLMVRGRGRGKS